MARRCGKSNPLTSFAVHTKSAATFPGSLSFLLLHPYAKPLRTSSANMGLDANDNRGWVMSGVAGIGASFCALWNMLLLLLERTDDIISLCYRCQHHLRGHYIAIMFSNSKLRYNYQYHLSFIVNGPECWSHGRFSIMEFILC